MKKRIMAITITLLVATAGALTLVQCDHSNMARVTIHIQNELYAQKNESVIDKLLNLVNTNLYAAAGWSSTVDGLTLKVSGSDIETIIADISPTSESYTIEVPAGAERTFTLLSSTSSGAVGTNWGGRIIEYIEPGENSLTIEMIPMTKITNGFSSAPEIYVAWESVSIDASTSYNLYRANSENGTYVKTDASPFTGSNTYDSGDFVEGQYYYYKIQVIADGKEGLLSEPYAIQFSGV